MKMKENTIKEMIKFFDEKIEMYGATNKAVDWNSEEGQRLRYVQLSKLFDKDTEKFSVCDFGCGYGYGLEFLRQEKFNCMYEGIDLCENMIKKAKEVFRNEKDCTFLHQTSIINQYDYIISSGVFNLKYEENYSDWTEYMIDTIEQYNLHSKKGFAFNCLTKYSDKEYMKDNLYYGDPLYFFDYCKKHFSRNVELLHGYDLYEFTIIVRK